MLAHQAFRYELNPTATQRVALANHAGAARWAWNWGLSVRRKAAVRPVVEDLAGCGLVKARLPLGERTFRCQRCGLVLDRDLNAARNLAGLRGVRLGWSPPVRRRP